MQIETKARGVALFALLCAPALAGPPALPARAFEAPARANVLTDVDDAGTVWARGANWKMSFDAGHVMWLPTLGKTAPRSPRLDLSLRGVSIGGVPVAFAAEAAPQQDGTRVTIARGPFVERFDLSPTTVEQSFVLAAPLGTGDLSIELGNATELTYVGRDGGLAFDADGRARVLFGDVTVVDANGARIALESRWAAGGIELRVPAAVLANAAYPLVIDPLITNLLVDPDTDDDVSPQVAFTNGSFLVVYTDATNVIDRDIIARRFDVAGTPLDEVPVDITGSIASEPAVAGANNAFMVAWINKPTLVSDPNVRARARTANNTSQGTAFDVSIGSNGEAHVDIGASPNPVAHPFYVVWDEDGFQVKNVQGRGIATNGSLGPILSIDVSANNAFTPRISADAGTNGVWLVVYETVVLADQRAVAYGIRDDGTQVTGAGSLRFHAIGVPLHPDVDGDGNNWLCVFEDPDPNAPGKADISGFSFTFRPDKPQQFIFPNNLLNLSKIELGASDAVSQTLPIVACEGVRFTYAYRGKASTLSLFDDLRTATVALDPFVPGEAVFTETNTVVVSGLVADPNRVAITSTRFASPGRMLIAWDNKFFSASDINAQLRSVLGTGGIATIQTGCGAPEPLLAITGSPGIGASISVSIIGALSPLLAIGPVINVPMCPGQAGCVLGVQPVLLFASPLSFSSPIPADPAFIGASIGMQVIDLLPANPPGPFCGPPFYAQTFRVSDTKVLTFQ